MIKEIDFVKLIDLQPECDQDDERTERSTGRCHQT